MNQHAAENTHYTEKIKELFLIVVSHYCHSQAL